METLYKKDNEGRIIVLNIYTNGCYLIQEFGLVEGKHGLKSKTCKGNHIGKPDEIVPEQQAVIEMIALAEKKLNEEYFRTKKEARDSNI